MIGLHLLVPSVARLGWLTTTISNPPPEQSRGSVFFFRGQLAMFSRSFGLLCDRLRLADVWAEDCRCIGDRWAVQHILAKRDSGREARPVVLIGHSRGGRRALQAAAVLAKRDIPVDLLICVDVAFAPPVPASVKSAVHLYRSWRRVYPARPLVRTDGTSTGIENLDLDAPDSPLAPAGIHHLNITHTPRIAEWIFRRALSAVEAR